MDKVLKGKPVVQKIVEELNFEKKKFLQCLMIGEEPSSLIYYKSLEKVARKLNVDIGLEKVDKNVNEEKLIEFIKELQSNCDGFLLFRPIPPKFDAIKVYSTIDVDKDVDCTNPLNLGKLFLGKSKVFPSTPLAVMKMIEYYNIDVSGKNVVVIGRSDTVGKPLSLMLLQRGMDATVTVCHTKTRDLTEHTLKADILIVAAGKPKLIKSNMIKDGAIIIDVGINVVDDKIVGDVDFEDCYEHVSAITPVPGGVGAVTRYCLFLNLYNLSK